MSTPSSLVADRYRLVRLLGAGGMGVVWEAWDERLHRTVALKMLRTQPELTDAERQTATDRALREARITAGLHHPHAVTVFDVVEHDGQPCIVMQLIESTPLSALLREHGTFTPSETARIGAQVASALAAAHKLKIVHRDVKPGNILIGADGSAMISDFGISHALGDTAITATGLVHGTPAYLAPEAARGLPMSFASDVFSLGSTLYAMTEGEPPFGSENNAIALLHKVARGGYPAPKHAGPLTPLLRRMLATQPKRRPTMAEVVESLNGMQHGPADAPAAAATVAFTPRTAPTAVSPGPTAETLRVDQPTRDEAATADTEVLGRRAEVAAAVVGAHEPSPATGDPAPATRGRRRRVGVVLGILVLLVALGVGAWVLTDPLRQSPVGSADPKPSSAATSSPAAETPATDSPTPATSPSTVDGGPAEPAPPAQTPEQRVVDAITGYYALMPDQRDSAWPLMTADYQENHAGGRGGYEAFWSGVTEVSVADVTASSADQGQATLTYRFSDGRVMQEVTAYRFVEEDGVLKIAGTDVLSSVEL